MGAEVEAADRLDQLSVALTDAQRAERSGKVLVTPAVQTASHQPRRRGRPLGRAASAGVRIRHLSRRP